MEMVSLGGSDTDPLLARVASGMPGAVAAVERFWGTDWQRDIVVVATDSDAQFTTRAHLDPNRSWTDIAAVAAASSPTSSSSSDGLPRPATMI